MLNNISKVLIIVGVIMTIVLKPWLENEWFEIIGFGLLMFGFYNSKEQIIGSNDEYGAYIYYTCMALFIILIFAKWFLV